MARWNPFGDHWSILYVGKAISIRARLRRHHKVTAAQSLKATHLHFLIERDGYERARLEAEMIWQLCPLLNERRPIDLIW